MSCGLEKGDEHKGKHYVELDQYEDEASETDEQPAQELEEPTVRRSERQWQPPNFYGEWANITDDILEPTTLKQALTSPDKSKWQVAMIEERNEFSVFTAMTFEN